MGPKTVLACLQDKTGRHRLTIPQYVKKQIDRIVSKGNERRKGARTKAKRKKPAKGKKAKYGRLTEKKRIQIETLWRQKYSQAAIARIVGCNRSTVKRKIDRNKSQKGYRHGKAQKRADERIRKKAADRQMARIDHLLNDRLMKCLGWRTPREVFMARLSHYLKAA